jgi:formylglycine-generating enzyme required for sulfatase activity
VWIDAGRFVRGSDEADVEAAVRFCERTMDPLEAQVICHPETFHDETPTQRVRLDAFGIDRTEVTVAAYRRCIGAGVCTPGSVSAADDRLSLPAHPITGVDFHQASRFCAWVGGRLPTEAEWERAARGHDRRRFPWGDAYNDRLANHGGGFRQVDPVDGHRFAAPVGSYPDGASPYGVLDLAGNAWEWTADLFAADAYVVTSPVNPRGPASGAQRVVRGGSWRYPPIALRLAHRNRLGEGESQPDLGFRCAYDP